MASTLPSECLLLVLAWLWDDDYELATRFFDRSSHCCAAYDQTRIHNVLRARSLAPLHVSRAWRQCAVPRFFRLAFIDLTTAATCELPPWVLPYVGRLFLALPSPAHPTSSSPGGYTEAACRLKRVLAAPLQHARVLGLCFAADSQGSVASGSPDPNILGRLLAHRMPCLERIWVQCSGALTRPAHVLINELQTSTPDSTPLSAHRHPRVTAIHLAASSRRNALAIDLIHMCASKLEFLCLGKVSGGVLGEITHATTHQPSGQTVIKLVIFPALKRLLFTVDANAHIYASLPDYRCCPFPNLVDLHFDDSLSNGLPREEWYAPIYDVFLKHSAMKLRRLTFPIVYNTQRTVSARNCPELVDLRHIKCCWATGPWSTTQPESDSTRLLKSIATIPTLRRYVNPSYIARLSDTPAEIGCLLLSHLDLYGWPLTLRNLAWVLRSFPCLTVLKATLTRATQWNSNTQHILHTTRSVETYKDGDLDIAEWSPVEHLIIGAADYGLAHWELPQLFGMLCQLMHLSTAFLYSGAYTYVVGANDSTKRCAGTTSTPAFRSITACISNLDNIEASHQDAVEPTGAVSQDPATLATEPPLTSSRLMASRIYNAAIASGSNSNNSANTSWHVIHRLLIGE